MYKNQINKLDEIIDKTLKTISESHDEIKEISHFAKHEYLELEEEFLKLKIEANYVIDKVEELELGLKKSKSRLLYVNKNYEKFSESDMKEVYDSTDKIRLELAVENERGIHLIRRRNELELHLKSVQKIYDKADKLSNDFNMAYGVLVGDLKQATEQMDGFQDKEIWGVKVLEAQEFERKRIARDMHDGPTQNLSNLLLKTELCIKLLDKDIDRTKLELNSLKLLIRATIEETRRLIHNLRPMSIDDLGLIPTIERLIDEMKGEVKFELNLTHAKNLELNLDPVMTLAVYRISQEALNNIKKYSQATKVEFEIKVEGDILNLHITDNGIGFDIDGVKLNLEDNRGFGISMMRERTNLLLGEFQIFSTKNKGTTITVKLPIILKKEVLKDE
ncbi:MAG: histidine kinase [Firmicutes bacterium HGW-Firmicutes-1]|jgi:two-component system sensor histidine kinase DegS|nr:MAG: histidine kinase [Firmicutes bacterium HGW-Firmicutes-1]